jgi:hypothetical protein
MQNEMSRSEPESERLFVMKKVLHHAIAEVPRRQAEADLTIGIDLEMSGAITASSTKLEK